MRLVAGCFGKLLATKKRTEVRFGITSLLGD